jgi:ABC-2 type transport system ATP-binding protein
MTESNTAAISLRGLEKHYGDTHALRGVSFDIRQGEYFGLLGPNGAGKSTLISIIGGLVQASAGDAAVLGHDVIRDYRRARHSLGLVPQELVYDPFFEVGKLLRMQAGYFGCGREQRPWIERVMRELDLTDKQKKTMRQLSGGQKRRVLIAQALVHRPPVVILDEPTAGVDVELRRILWDFTRELHGEGHTIVLTTHYLEEAEALCERIAIIDQGELNVLEDKQALLARYPYRRLRLTLAGDKPLPESVRRLVVSREGNDLELRLHRDHDTIGDILDELRAAGLRVRDIQTREPHLEDIFVELTQKNQGGYAGEQSEDQAA